MKAGITTIAGLLGLGLLKRLGSKALVNVEAKTVKSLNITYTYYLYCDEDYLDD